MALALGSCVFLGMLALFAVLILSSAKGGVHRCNIKNMGEFSALLPFICM